jgi:hypothetical protein
MLKMTDKQKRWKRWYKKNRLKVLARAKKYRLEHLEKIKKQQRKSVKKHIKRVRTFSKKYYRTHRKQILARARTYAGNPKVLKRRREWYAENRKKILKGLKARRKRLGKKCAAYQREWKSRDIEKVRRQARAYGKGYRKTKAWRFLKGKHWAKSIGRGWFISKKEHSDLLDKPCYYCGKFLADEMGWSLDRISNQGDYILNNVLPCCGTCNRIKGTQLSVEEMKYAMNKLLITSSKELARIKAPKYVFSDMYPQHEYWVVTQYKKLFQSARTRKLVLKISFDDYSKLVSLPCFYCERILPRAFGYCLDRINNSKGYLLNNVIPCCGDCNSVRSDKLSFEETVVFMKAVVKYRQQRRSR